MIKLKDLLNEELVGTIASRFNKKYQYDVYKNPKSIKKMYPLLKGVSLPNGDFYVVDGSEVLHSDIANRLKFSDFFRNEKSTMRGFEKGYIAWEREDSNRFNLAAPISTLPDSHFNIVKKFVKKINQKNPQYIFNLRTSYQ